MSPGYAVAEGEWGAGDEIRLDLPMTPRWTLPDRRVDALRGCAAVERGPVVYCAESVGDIPELALVEARVSPPVEHLVDGVVELDVESARLSPETGAWPYTPAQETESPDLSDPEPLRLVPYHRWGNRGPATMRVWLPAINRPV